MQAPQTQKKPPLAVLFDSSLDGDIDQVLALAMLFGLAGRQQARVASLSTSVFNLRAARFLDLVARFYAGDQPGVAASRNALRIGSSSANNTAAASPSVAPSANGAAGPTRSHRNPASRLAGSNAAPTAA